MGDKKISITTGEEHKITVTDEERAILGAARDFLCALLPGMPQQDLSTFMRAMPQHAGPDWHAPQTEPTYVAVPVNVEEDDEDGWIWDINIDHIICKETEHYYGEPTQAESDEYLNKALKSIRANIELFKTDNPPTSLPDVAHIIGVTATKRRQSDPPTPHPAAELAKAGKGVLTPEQAEYYLGFKRDKKPVNNPVKKEEENTNSIKYTSSAFPSATTVTGVNPIPAENKSNHEHKSGLDKAKQTAPDVGKKDGNNHTHLSDSGIKFVKEHEGFVGHVYNDAKGRDSYYYKETDHTLKDKHGTPRVDRHGKPIVGNPTIGYGHLLTPEELSQRKWENGMTKTEAEALFLHDKHIREDAVSKLVHVPLTPSQFDAIVDFAYNVGVGSTLHKTGLAGSDFLAKLNKGNYDGDLMLHFPTQPDRRKDEVTLFNTGKYQVLGKDMK